MEVESEPQKNEFAICSCSEHLVHCEWYYARVSSVASCGPIEVARYLHDNQTGALYNLGSGS